MMKGMELNKHFFLLWVLLLSCTQGLFAQSFEARCNSTVVSVGQPFEVSFNLVNAQAKSFKPPSLVGFSQVGTTSSSGTSVVNGRASTIFTTSISLVANREGSFKIGAAEVITKNGKVLRTKPITIKVVPAAQSPMDNLPAQLSGKVFVRTEVSNENPVVGEQVTVDIKIYTMIDIEQIEIIKEPAFDNLFSHYVRSYNGPKSQEVVQGETYTTKVLRRIVVFPSKSGIVMVEPAMVDIGVPVNGGGSMFNPFYQLASYTLKSLPVELNVKSLDGVPAGYSGMVGNFIMMAHVDKNEISSDDVVQLKVRVRGQGDMKQLLAPDLGVNEKYFDQFEPNSNEEIREANGLLGGTKDFDYVLTPKVTGSFEINPRFTYFDIQKRKFVTIDTTIQIKISKGKLNLPTTKELDEQLAARRNATPVIEDKDLLSFKAPQRTAVFQAEKTLFWGSFVFWIFALIPLVGLGGVYYKKSLIEKLEAVPESVRKKQYAGSEASRRLGQAKQHMEKSDAKAFYNEISKALLGFMADKFSIPTIELTKKNVRQKLQEEALSEDKIENLMQILHTCDMALFAGMTGGESMLKVYQDSEELIKLMEA